MCVHPDDAERRIRLRRTLSDPSQPLWPIRTSRRRGVTPNAKASKPHANANGCAGIRATTHQPPRKRNIASKFPRPARHGRP